MRQEEQILAQPTSDDQSDTGMNIISFIIPLIGAIIYFTNKANSPNKAQAAGRAALWGLEFAILLNLLVFVSGKS